MYSFYGGKQGLTYHIVERFDTLYFDPGSYSGKEYSSTTTYSIGDEFLYNNRVYIVLENNLVIPDIEVIKNDTTKLTQLKAMVNEFQRGAAYTDVKYGQYVIIDTILKTNHKDDDRNGLLYRRGMDYTQAASGVSRPDKRSRDFWNQDGSFKTATWTAAWINYVTNPGGGAEYIGQIVGPQGDSPQLIGQSWSEYVQHHTDSETGLINGQVLLDRTPGAILNGAATTFSDNVIFGSYTVKDADGNVTGAHISFDIPYPVFRVGAIPVNPYTFTTDLSTVASTVDQYLPVHTEIGNSTVHWTPNSTALLHQYDYGNSTVHPFFHDMQIAIPHGKKGDSIELISTVENENTHWSQLGYQIRKFDNQADGILQPRIKIADYNIITDMAVQQNIRNYITLEPGVTTTVSLGDLYHYMYTPSTGESAQYDLLCVQSGIFSYDDFQGWDPSQESQKWHQIPISDQSSEEPNEGDEDEQILQGACFRVYDLPNPAPASLNTTFSAAPVSTYPLNNVDFIYLNPKGQVYASYTNDNSQNYLGSLKQIEKIEYKHDLYDDPYGIQIVYRQGDVISGSNVDEINYQPNMLVAIDRQGDNLIVLYSNAKVRRRYLEKDPETGQDLYQQGVDYYLREDSEEFRAKYAIDSTLEQGETGDKLIEKQVNGQIVQVPGLVWVNFTGMQGQLHVYGDYTKEEVFNLIPHGFEGDYSDRAGWIISVTEQEDRNGELVTLGKGLYAFNYKRWQAKKDADPTSDGNPTSDAELQDGNVYLFDRTRPIYTWWYRIRDLSAQGVETRYILQFGQTTTPGVLDINPGGLLIIPSTVHSHTI